MCLRKDFKPSVPDLVIAAARTAFISPSAGKPARDQRRGADDVGAGSSRDARATTDINLFKWAKPCAKVSKNKQFALNRLPHFD
ncbi:hypothetical protein EVAR_10701_1 [Eumeta japonica]|uniref:Uncharacterized protein n=1 Tax=Eumeta variegata TaxID=151549 RepID=A0A4C1U795_EUMVA|nr:hypothetical protein EVAR_10701_1 [Eumeta japonica]